MDGVKTCYKQTLLNLVSQYKPTTMVLWGNISESVTKFRIVYIIRFIYQVSPSPVVDLCDLIRATKNHTYEDSHYQF